MSRHDIYYRIIYVMHSNINWNRIISDLKIACSDIDDEDINNIIENFDKINITDNDQYQELIKKINLVLTNLNTKKKCVCNISQINPRHIY